MIPNIVLFNNACADGDLTYIKENINQFKPENMEFGLRLASSYDNLNIVSFILESDILSRMAQNCSTQEDNAFMSSFSNNEKKENRVTKYLLEERKYEPPESILFWIEENSIEFDTSPYWK